MDRTKHTVSCRLRELNMLGAALAVLEWKAKVGIYRNDRSRDMDTILVSASTGRLLQDRKGDSPT